MVKDTRCPPNLLTIKTTVGKKDVKLWTWHVWSQHRQKKWPTTITLFMQVICSFCMRYPWIWSDGVGRWIWEKPTLFDKRDQTEVLSFLKQNKSHVYMLKMFCSGCFLWSADVKDTRSAQKTPLISNNKIPSMHCVSQTALFRKRKDNVPL